MRSVQVGRTYQGWAAVFLLLGTLTISATTQAQVANTGSVRGSVSDPSGAALSGAGLTLVEVHTGASQETKTDAAGSFNFPIVPVGSYRLQVTMMGFKSFAEAGISVHAAEPTNLAVTLTVGATSEKIEIGRATCRERGWCGRGAV